MKDLGMWVAAGLLLVLGFEVLAGRHRGVYRKGDFPLIIGSLGIGHVLIAPLTGLLVAAMWGAVLPAYKGALAETSFWLAFPAVLLVNEFFFYWVHRWCHRAARSQSLLWMIHRTHHSATYMNVAVWLRLNVFWYVIIPTAWTIGLAVYLGLGNAAGAAVMLIAIWNIVTHSDFRWDDAIRRHRLFGPAFRALEHVIVSPGIHHTHHGYGKDGASYRNFGVMLSLYDWIFGTLHIPDGRPTHYGIPGHHAHWAEELFYPLVSLRQKEPGQALRSAANE